MNPQFSIIPNANPKQIKKRTAQFLKQKILLHTNTNNKNTCKTVCKMRYLTNLWKFNISEDSASSFKPIPTDVF